MKIIGIDLGTTHSLISYFEDRTPKVIPNTLGEKLTPSIVSIDNDGNIFVGNIAKEMLITNPENTVKVFKRTMGMKKDYDIGNKKYNAIELSSFVIKSLLEDAKAYLGEEVKKVVISVPAYFNDMQRKATKMAGELAGVEVVRIVSEPTCAALAYGISEDKEDSTFLIFDLGGGTFDISILEMNDSIIEVISIAGDNYLGGEDFTDILVKIFLKHYEIDEFEISAKNLNIVNRACEEAKISLGNEKAFKVKCTLDDEEYKLNIPLENFEKECEEIFNKIKNTTARAMKDAKKRLEDIDHIVLVGGATRLDLIKQFVIRLFNKMPLHKLDPDEVVALGVAVQCGMIERNGAISEIILTDVCSYTLGTSISKTQANGTIKHGYYLPIIERNTTIPVSRVERLYTLYDMQEKITIDILQGESFNASENLSIGKMEIEVPKNPAGQECVDVRYTYNINGILEVEIEVISTGKKEVCVLEKAKGLFTEEEIKEKLEEIKHLKVHPRNKERNKLILQKAKNKFEQSSREERFILTNYIFEFEVALEKQDSNLISINRKKLEDYLKED